MLLHRFPRKRDALPSNNPARGFQPWATTNARRPGKENEMKTNTISATAAARQDLLECLTGESRIGYPGFVPELRSGAVYRAPWHAKALAEAFARIGGDTALVPYNWGPFGGYQGRVEDPERVKRAQAEVGWVRAAADLAERWPTAKFLLVKFFTRGINAGGGANSPYSCLTDIPVGRWAPGTLVRRMRAIRRKARVLMATSVTIKEPSWASVAVAAAGPLSVAKAAVSAWAMTLRAPRLEREQVYRASDWLYRGERSWLTEHLCSAPKRTTFRDWSRGVEAGVGSAVETVEGVRAIHRPATVRHGVAMQRTVLLQESRRGKPSGRTVGYLVSIGGFQYHADEWRESGAVKAAIEAFRRAQDARTVGAEVLPKAARKAFLAGEFEILVTRQDSYAAGNCSPGTEAFIASKGWRDRWCAPASVLLASGNPRAVAAAQVALRRFAEAA